MRDDDIRRFYDSFADSTLLRDLRSVNPRQRAVVRLCREFIDQGKSVLEIGCGIGIITRQIARLASRVTAVDVSPNNIRIAREFAGTTNCEWHVGNILDPDTIRQLRSPYDVVLMADVVEHIPKNRYGTLFRTIERSLSDGGRVLLTFPSAAYQRHLRQANPDALQVVDEEVDVSEILARTSLEPIALRMVDAFGNRSMYVHLALSHSSEFGYKVLKPALHERAWWRLRNAAWSLRNRAILAKLQRAGKAAVPND